MQLDQFYQFQKSLEQASVHGQIPRERESLHSFKVKMTQSWPNLGPESVGLFYENDLLGIRIDLWPLFWVSVSLLLLLYFKVIGVFDKDNYKSHHHASHGYGARGDHVGQHRHHHGSGAPLIGGGPYKSAIDRLHARVHALQEKNDELEGSLFDSFIWEKGPSITGDDVFAN